TPSLSRALRCSFRRPCDHSARAGYITGFACQTLVPHVWLKWRVMLGIGILPPAVIMMCLTFLPESPRWLISRGRIREGREVKQECLRNDSD
ncbi:unnamed protein product, partial [Hapterophycus canaliculatus]